MRELRFFSPSVPSCQWLGDRWQSKRRQIFNTIDGDLDSTVVIGGDVVDSNAEVELSFGGDADLLMEEESAVKSAVILSLREILLANSA